MSNNAAIRLGVNVDHVATVRQARGTNYPDPLEAAKLSALAGAHSITIHLREDRRHIQDHDVERMRAGCGIPVNLEMAATAEMVKIALANKPEFVCFVPEKRQELTTEGGLDVAGNLAHLVPMCKQLEKAGIAVSLFVDADSNQLAAILETGARNIEIHTGAYADAENKQEAERELIRIAKFAALAKEAGLGVHAGHGLTLENVAAVAAISQITELNIGHSIIARALMVGMRAAVAEMLAIMTKART